MALDVYVGSLTRYYMGDWKSTADLTTPERGGKTEADRPALGVDPKKDRERIHASVLAWRRALEAAIASYRAGPLSWDETAAAPWFADRPGWHGFGALVLWASYAEQPALRPPVILPKEWDDDAALVRSNAHGFRSRYSHLVRNVELWLPTDLDFTFEAEDVDGRRIIIGSSTALLRQLGELNDATWKMDADALAALAGTRAPGGGPLEDAARHAMAMMTGLVMQAVAHRLPVKLDY